MIVILIQQGSKYVVLVILEHNITMHSSCTLMRTTRVSEYDITLYVGMAQKQRI